jgi:hypothetical protein
MLPLVVEKGAARPEMPSPGALASGNSLCSCRRRAQAWLLRLFHRLRDRQWRQAPTRNPRRQESQVHDPRGRSAALRRQRSAIPAECTGARKELIEGRPDPKQISTSFSERSNLTLRMHMRRFTRLTNAFSKKVENHAHAVALHMMYYNFVRIGCEQAALGNDGHCGRA